MSRIGFLQAHPKTMSETGRLPTTDHPPPTADYRSKSRSTSSYQSLLSFSMTIIWFFSMAIPI